MPLASHTCFCVFISSLSALPRSVSFYFLISILFSSSRLHYTWIFFLFFKIKFTWYYVYIYLVISQFLDFFFLGQFFVYNILAVKERITDLYSWTRGSNSQRVRKMKFKEGSSVEVLRKKKDLYGSWYSGSILRTDGDYYVIRYKFLVDQRGDLVVERVSKKNIRPQPPQQKRKQRWFAGDMAEVFDAECWRVGKVAKVFCNKRLVVKFFGSIQLKEFQVSNLRICQVWHENKWSSFAEVRELGTLLLHCPFLTENSMVGYAKLNALPVQNHKQEVNNSEQDSSGFGLACSAPLQAICEKTTIPDAEGFNKPLIVRHSLIRHVGNTTSLQIEAEDNNIKAGKETTYDRIQDSNECSVASCSLNETADWTGGISHRTYENVSHGSDAESAFPALPCKRNKAPSHEHELEVASDIHNLELQAYKATVEALYASGPLSWEQESLLTNLRLSLHISNDEHLLQLRHLLSARIL